MHTKLTVRLPRPLPLPSPPPLQDLSNLLFSLAVWRVSVSQPFLQRTLSAFRGHWGSAGCTAPALVRFIYALTQLPACQDLPPKLLQVQPEGAAVYLHHEAYRQQRELEVMGGVMGLSLEDAAAVAATGAAIGPTAAATAAVDTGQQQQQTSDVPPAAEPSNSSSSYNSKKSSSKAAAVATYRLPSFNWLTTFLAECRRQIDRFKPAELSTLLWSSACLNHAPDLIFMEAWFRASAARMHAFTPATLAAAVQALGMLQPGKDVPGAVAGRWLQLVLTHSQQLMQQQRGQGVAAAAAAAGQRGKGQKQAIEQQQQPGLLFSISDLSKLLWGLAELKIWPGKPWMDSWMAGEGLSRLDRLTDHAGDYEVILSPLFLWALLCISGVCTAIVWLVFSAATCQAVLHRV